MITRIGGLIVGAMACVSLGTLALEQPGFAQAPGDGPPRNGPPRIPMQMEPDPRVQQRTYHFTDTGEDLAYTVFVSSKVRPDVPAPLIVALHGYGGDSNFIVRGRLVDLAEEGGYIVVGPMGYNVTGWYGSPVIVIGGGPVDPPNLAELSEKDVMNVLAIARGEFNVDPERTYLMGHSMGGAGTLFLGQKHAEQWAAIAAIAPAAFLMQPNRKDILAPIRAAGLPLMITQGDQDPVVPANSTRTWAAAMEELGLEHDEYIEMAGRDHGNIIADGMPEIFRFFSAHTRKAR
jgi:predicted peptidase